jgi:hypothetical protein
MTILQIIFWILLLDSLIALYISWCGKQEYSWYWSKIEFFRKHMPLTKGWTAWYLILALFIGYIVYLY